jgi:adenylate cyclase
MIRIGLALIALLALPLALQVTPLEILKLKVFDTFVEKHKPSEYFTILNITDSDVRAEGGYPFPRQRLAEINEQIMAKGALGVGFVISFIDKDRFGGDSLFLNSIQQHSTVVATFETDNGLYPKPTGTVLLGEETTGIQLQGYMPNIPLIADVALEGMVSAPVDADNLVRRLPLLLQTPDGWIPSFGTQVLKSLVGADTFIIKTNTAGIEEIRVRGLPQTKVDSLGRQWISWVDTPQTTLQEMAVKDKFVFVGVTAKGVMPQLAVSSGQLLEPHKIQAALAESMLIPNSPYIPYWHLVAELSALLLLCLLIWLVSSFLGLTWSITLGSVIFCSTALYGYYTIRTGLLLDFSYTLIAEFVTASVAYYLNFRKQYKLRQQIKKQFEHYLDPRQVKRLQDNPGLLKLGGEKRYCTFLFTDVRGFTVLSETKPPEEVTAIMNKALTIQAKAVQEHGGMVDKYIGDAMMAIFNAPIDLAKHEEAAIKAALQIKHEMQAAQLGIDIGIGINAGQAVLGNMGSETRFDYTAIGDAVNTAARLESATKEAGVDLLIGESTAQAVDYELQSLKPIKVKGKAKPLKIYTYG